MSFMLNVTNRPLVLGVVMSNAVMLSEIMLNVVAPFGNRCNNPCQGVPI